MTLGDSSVSKTRCDICNQEMVGRVNARERFHAECFLNGTDKPRRLTNPLPKVNTNHRAPLYLPKEGGGYIAIK